MESGSLWTSNAKIFKIVNNIQNNADGYCQPGKPTSKKFYGNSFHKNSVSYLILFINVHAFLLIFPFRVVYSKEEKKFVASSSKFRKILGFLFHSFLIFILIIWVYPSIRLFIDYYRNVSFGFLIVGQICICIATCALLKTIWFNIDGIIELCNLMAVHKLKLSRKRKFFEIFVLCITNLVMVLYMVQGHFSKPRDNMAKSAYRMIEPVFITLSDIFGFDFIAWLKELIGRKAVSAIGISIFSFFVSLTHLPLTTFLALGISLNNMVTFGIQELVEADGNINAAQVKEEYEKLRYTTNCLKDTFSSFVIFFYVLTQSFFTYLPQMAVNLGADVLFVYVHLSIVSSSLFIATLAHLKAEDSIRDFIHHQHRSLEINFSGIRRIFDSRVQLLALSEDLKNNPIGISCSMFTLTKSFFTSTIGIISTYLLVILQAQD